MAKSILRCAAPGILLAILCLAPFLNKAFTIDDPFFLVQAKQALRTPLTPTATELCWDNIGYPRPIRALGPPGLAMSYALVPVVLLQSKEWAGHLLQLIFFSIAIAATVALALRCGASKQQAMIVGLFCASFPPLLSMAGTVMPDVLATMLAAIGLERLLAWKQDGRWHQAFAAGIALAIATLARSHTLLLWPIGILLLLGNRDQISWRALPDAIRETKLTRLMPILIAAICLIAMNVITAGDADLSSSISPVGPNEDQIYWSRAFSNFLQLGLNWLWVTPFAIVWLLLDGLAGAALFVASILAGGLIKLAFPSSPIILDVGGCLGILLLASAIAWAFRTQLLSRIVLALTLLIAIPMIVFQHMPAKYLAPCAPAVAILLVFRMSEKARPMKLWSAAIVCAGVAIGCAIISADTQFAGMARQAVAEAIAPRIQSGHRAWYSGQWALTWYGEQTGATCLSINPPFPESGDVIIAGEVEDGTSLVRRMDLKLQLIQTISSAGSGVRIMNPRAHAGFYSNWFGYLPLTWSNEPVNKYYVWLVE